MCRCSDFGEIKDLIHNVKIKKRKRSTQIPKFTLWIYTFVYQRLMDFPHGRFDYETLTTLNFLESVHRIINVIIHLHHLHLTGKITGYAHGFCNMKERENQNPFSCIAHNCFGFEMFFLIKRTRLSVWGQKMLT